MVYIKKLVMYGFKSFPKKTEIPFDQGINVVLGPNGSGKSNISDALCFVLGRLSIKSMRAAKASNLIFMGSKIASPAKEAIVEIVFDNSDNVFSIDSSEISIKRVVRKNGLSIYKINNEVKTRQDILFLLAQAGIDPNGFNIILQGEIQNFVRMHTEERRQVIEEVSGISVYEMRKEKSLKELGRTEEKLKEVSAILRERTAYLNNLEKERQQALKFKKLEQDVRRLKSSIISYDLGKKKKQSSQVTEEIKTRSSNIEKIKKEIVLLQTNISNSEDQIAKINLTIKQSTGFEQEKLNVEIANLRAELAGLNVKLENFEAKLSSLQKQKVDLANSTREMDISVKDLQKESPTLVKKEKELQAKKAQLEKFEEQRKDYYTTKSEIKSLRERMQDKKTLFQNYTHESDFILKQIETLGSELFDRKSSPTILETLKAGLVQKRERLNSLNLREREIEKISHTNEFEIDKQNKLIEKISKMDICPVCKSKITENHVHSIKGETLPEIEKLKSQIKDATKELKEINSQRELLNKEIEKISEEISKRNSDLLKLETIREKTQQLKALQEKINEIKVEGSQLDKKLKALETNFENDSDIEHKYETARLEVQEISLRSEENVNSEISFKQRELERAKLQVKQIAREEEEIEEELGSLKSTIESKEESLEKKKKQEDNLSKQFNLFISQRDSLQSKIREVETEVSKKQNVIYTIEQDVNNFKIEKARYDAEIENYEIEMLEFSGIEPIRLSREALVEKLANVQDVLSKIGSVNLRSLEVYDEIKAEYDQIQNKVEIITKEKDGIFRIIHEIDIRKRKTFLKTLEDLNEIFSRNFAQISTKGAVSLELENKKEPFEGGVAIQVKTGHGKYFDVTSLSGGEQTMVALSLIFAIQELRPYCFYILDEIDAALDKRNSERLANLLNKYMQKGQYIIITHNDEIISNATNLYGVSM
ncbi:MAG: chromosome segregation SMC family protein, partial [Nanoarchaeota archaeon]